MTRGQKGPGPPWPPPSAACASSPRPCPRRRGLAAAQPAGVSELALTQEVDGETVSRRVFIHAPAEGLRDGTSYPLLFCLHGNGTNAPPSAPPPHSGFLRNYGPLVERGEFVGVYPEGLQRSWNLGPEASNADDVSSCPSLLPAPPTQP